MSGPPVLEGAGGEGPREGEAVELLGPPPLLLFPPVLVPGPPDTPLGPPSLFRPPALALSVIWSARNPIIKGTNEE